MSERPWRDLADEEYCYLTTTGRVTGNPHTIEIWFAVHDDTLFLLSGGADEADWVRNLRADPVVTVRIAGEEYAARARLVADRAEDAAARRLLYEKYNPGYGGDLANWRDNALPIAVDHNPAD